MSLSRAKMNQDELEEEILVQSVYSQAQLVMGMIQSLSSHTKGHLTFNIALVVTFILMLLTLLWYIKDNLN